MGFNENVFVDDGEENLERAYDASRGPILRSFRVPIHHRQASKLSGEMEQYIAGITSSSNHLAICSNIGTTCSVLIATITFIAMGRMEIGRAHV